MLRLPTSLRRLKQKRCQHSDRLIMTRFKTCVATRPQFEDLRPRLSAQRELLLALLLDKQYRKAACLWKQLYLHNLSFALAEPRLFLSRGSCKLPLHWGCRRDQCLFWCNPGNVFGECNRRCKYFVRIYTMIKLKNYPGDPPALPSAGGFPLPSRTKRPALFLQEITQSCWGWHCGGSPVCF